jgi:hypothetical protein
MRDDSCEAMDNTDVREIERLRISVVTLFAGFASTVFWPLTLNLNTMLGWRDTYVGGIYATARRRIERQQPDIQRTNA